MPKKSSKSVKNTPKKGKKDETQTSLLSFLTKPQSSQSSSNEDSQSKDTTPPSSQNQSQASKPVKIDNDSPKFKTPEQIPTRFDPDFTDITDLLNNPLDLGEFAAKPSTPQVFSPSAPKERPITSFFNNAPSSSKASSSKSSSQNDSFDDLLDYDPMKTSATSAAKNLTNSSTSPHMSSSLVTPGKLMSSSEFKSLMQRIMYNPFTTSESTEKIRESEAIAKEIENYHAILDEKKQKIEEEELESSFSSQTQDISATQVLDKLDILDENITSEQIQESKERKTMSEQLKLNFSKNSEIQTKNLNTKRKQSSRKKKNCVSFMETKLFFQKVIVPVFEKQSMTKKAERTLIQLKKGEKKNNDEKEAKIPKEQEDEKEINIWELETDSLNWMGWEDGKDVSINDEKLKEKSEEYRKVLESFDFDQYLDKQSFLIHYFTKFEQFVRKIFSAKDNEEYLAEKQRKNGEPEKKEENEEDEEEKGKKKSKKGKKSKKTSKTSSKKSKEEEKEPETGKSTKKTPKTPSKKSKEEEKEPETGKSTKKTSKTPSKKSKEEEKEPETGKSTKKKNKRSPGKGFIIVEGEELEKYEKDFEYEDPEKKKKGLKSKKHDEDEEPELKEAEDSQQEAELEAFIQQREAFLCGYMPAVLSRLVKEMFTNTKCSVDPNLRFFIKFERFYSLFLILFKKFMYFLFVFKFTEDDDGFGCIETYFGFFETLVVMCYHVLKHEFGFLNIFKETVTVSSFSKGYSDLPNLTPQMDEDQENLLSEFSKNAPTTIEFHNYVQVFSMFYQRKFSAILDICSTILQLLPSDSHTFSFLDKNFSKIYELNANSTDTHIICSNFEIKDRSFFDTALDGWFWLKLAFIRMASNLNPHFTKEIIGIQQFYDEKYKNMAIYYQRERDTIIKSFPTFFDKIVGATTNKRWPRFGFPRLLENINSIFASHHSFGENEAEAGMILRIVHSFNKKMSCQAFELAVKRFIIELGYDNFLVFNFLRYLIQLNDVDMDYEQLVHWFFMKKMKHCGYQPNKLSKSEKSTETFDVSSIEFQPCTPEIFASDFAEEFERYQSNEFYPVLPAEEYFKILGFLRDKLEEGLKISERSVMESEIIFSNVVMLLTIFHLGISSKKTISTSFLCFIDPLLAKQAKEDYANPQDEALNKQKPKENEKNDQAKQENKEIDKTKQEITEKKQENIEADEKKQQNKEVDGDLDMSCPSDDAKDEEMSVENEEEDGSSKPMEIEKESHQIPAESQNLLENPQLFVSKKKEKKQIPLESQNLLDNSEDFQFKAPSPVKSSKKPNPPPISFDQSQNLLENPHPSVQYSQNLLENSHSQALFSQNLLENDIVPRPEVQFSQNLLENTKISNSEVPYSQNFLENDKNLEETKIEFDSEFKIPTSPPKKPTKQAMEIDYSQNLLENPSINISPVKRIDHSQQNNQNSTKTDMENMVDEIVNEHLSQSPNNPSANYTELDFSRKTEQAEVEQAEKAEKFKAYSLPLRDSWKIQPGDSEKIKNVKNFRKYLEEIQEIIRFSKRSNDFLLGVIENYSIFFDRSFDYMTTHPHLFLDYKMSWTEHKKLKEEKEADEKLFQKWAI